MIPFQKEDFHKQSFISLLLGKKKKENALVEINNILADRKDLRSITPDEIAHLADAYKINLKRDFAAKRCELYQKYLSFCLRDKKLSKSEIAILKYLKELLFLNDDQVEQVHQKVAGEVYRNELEKALEDQRLSEEEKFFLKNLQNDLKLSNQYVEDIYKESAEIRVKRLISDIISDERLSPKDEAELQAIGKNLNVDLQLCEKTEKMLEKYKLFWQIENGSLPVIDVRLNLQKSEKCRFHSPCNWFETRKVSKRLSYAGPTLRLKIIKGVYWRAGSLGGKIISEDQWRKIDSGEFYLTDKRLIFRGNSGNKTIKLDRILDFTVYDNGVDIQKDRGKCPFIEFSNNNDLFALILGKLLG